jgi:hypothetical protein
MIHDICRDWQRWTMAERVLAAVMVAILLIVTPATFLVTA